MCFQIDEFVTERWKLKESLKNNRYLDSVITIITVMMAVIYLLVCYNLLMVIASVIAAPPSLPLLLASVAFRFDSCLRPAVVIDGYMESLNALDMFSIYVIA